jgi:hypothetical protein
MDHRRKNGLNQDAFIARQIRTQVRIALRKFLRERSKGYFDRSGRYVSAQSLQTTGERPSLAIAEHDDFLLPAVAAPDHHLRIVAIRIVAQFRQPKTVQDQTLALLPKPIKHALFHRGSRQSENPSCHDSVRSPLCDGRLVEVDGRIDTLEVNQSALM